MNKKIKGFGFVYITLKTSITKVNNDMLKIDPENILLQKWL